MVTGLLSTRVDGNGRAIKTSAWHPGCSITRQEHGTAVTAIRIAIAAIWVAIALLAQGTWMTTPVPPNDTPPLVYDFPTTAVSGITSDGAEELDAPASASPRIDLYGNEVEQAVTDYRVDPRGDIYENHAPETAVTKLGPAGV